MRAAVVAVRLPTTPVSVERDYLHLGQYPCAGRSLTVNSSHLERDGQAWLPIMGEFHYSRYPEAEWEEELLKMRAGGINIVASYVFWNHHEEVEGQFNWSGQRSLRRFVQLVQQVGLEFYLRPGPWVHAESRNGGFPDWLQSSGELRCNHAAYLQRVARWYDQIGAQLQGLMWCDGGPVIGVQLENEYDRVGPGCGAEHIAELKRLAIAAGLTVPLYTVTGWPTLDIPPRDVVPVSGAYADGFWSGASQALPASGVFLFNTSRSIGEMGNVGGTPATALIDKAHYPFFLAEAGGGMHVSYHRRPVVSTDDVVATALVQIGSGANLYGYYMYHGGTNPHSPLGRLQETQATGYPNDVPVLGYDFRAPLGQYGQSRASYGRLRALHSFAAAFGAELAPMEAVVPADAPADPADRSHLRVAARGLGRSGYVFVNNHVRHHPMPDFAAVQLQVACGEASVEFPVVRVPSGASFIWPVGLEMGRAVLRYATVQPLTRLRDGAGQTLVFFSHPEIPAELCFARSGVQRIEAPAEWLVDSAEGWRVRPPASSAPQWLAVVDADGLRHTVLLLPRSLADHCQRLTLLGRERLVLCEHSLFVQNDSLVFALPQDEPACVSVYPADDLDAGAAGGFMEFVGRVPPQPAGAVRAELLHLNPEPPAVRMGPHIAWRQGPVPLAPDDAEFAEASHWRLHLDASPPADGCRMLLTVDYIGDAARLYADGVLVDDHFNDGEPWYIGLDRFAPAGHWPALTLRIVAANRELPIFLEDAAWQRLAQSPHQIALNSLQLARWRKARLAFTPQGSSTWLA